ncbi:MAG: nucleotide exchange factor GrpE [Nitrospinae bacterium]|nr:nucleotide exchange factor GrpE [Nitrospinota bacterium]
MEQNHAKGADAPKKESAIEKEIRKREAARKDKKGGDKEGKGAPKADVDKDSEIARLCKALEDKTKEAASHYEQLLRVRAEFENFKKRQAKENAQFLKYSNENLIKSLLPVISNLERANDAAKSNKDIESLRVGVEMILSMFYEALKRAGVEPVQSSGLPFDPSRHEVVSCVESGEHEENTVMHEFEKGYLLHDRLLCPAKVVVSKKPSGNGEASEGKT